MRVTIFIASLYAAVLILLAVVVVREYRDSKRILKFQTMAGTTKVYTVTHNGKTVRVMKVGSALQSATYLGDDDYCDLTFGCHKEFNRMFEAELPIRDVCILGGGGFSFPKYLMKYHPEVFVDAVEIDEEVINIANDHFFLKRAQEEFDPEAEGRLGVYCDDARHFLESSEKCYDVILNDCFAGGFIIEVLATLEMGATVHERLREGGLYIFNVIAPLEGEGSQLLWSVVKTLQQVFVNVHLIPCDPEYRERRQNTVVIATDGAYSFKQTVSYEVPEFAEVLRDASLA